VAVWTSSLTDLRRSSHRIRRAAIPLTGIRRDCVIVVVNDEVNETNGKI
jgi:hypothetical protein